MSNVIRFPPSTRTGVQACPLLALFRKLDPVEQLAIVKATEIVIATRKILDPPTDSDG
jgi:hypothetical protein